MNITKENIDELNAIVKIDITQEDYQNKVDEILQDYGAARFIGIEQKYGHNPQLCYY